MLSFFVFLVSFAVKKGRDFNHKVHKDHKGFVNEKGYISFW